jgi:small subunit ribosomal protein S21
MKRLDNRQAITYQRSALEHRKRDRFSHFRPIEVDVKDNLDKALRALKNRMSREGVLQEIKKRRFFEKPSVKRKRKIREAQKRLRRSLKRQT